MLKNRKLFSVLLLFLFSVSMLWGQTKKRGYLVSPKGDTVVINAIPLEKISENIKKSEDQIRTIKEAIVPDAELIKFDSIYKTGLHKLDVEKAKIDSTKEFGSIRNIENILRIWAAYESVIQNWEVKINQRIKILINDEFDVVVLESRWDSTLKKTTADGVADDQLTSATDILGRVRDLKETLIISKNEASRKQDLISKLGFTVDSVYLFLDKKKSVLQSSYFIEDSPPIWHGRDNSTHIDNIKSDYFKIRDGLKVSIKFFISLNKSLIIIHILILLLFWVAFYFLDKNSTKIEDQSPEILKSRLLISNHWAPALILSLFLSIWIYPDVGSDISNLLQLSFLIIALILLPRLIEKKLYLTFSLLLVLFALDVTEEWFNSKVFFFRILLLATNVYAAALFFIVMRPQSLITQKLKTYNWGWIRKVCFIFFLAMFVSILANIFGFVNIARLISNTVLNSLFNIVILVLATMVMNRSISIMLLTPFFQESHIVRKNRAIIEKYTSRIVYGGGVFLWLKALTGLLGIYDGMYSWFLEAINAEWAVGSTTISFGGIVNFLLVILLTVIIARFIKTVLNDEIFPRVTLPRGVPGAISMITGYVVVIYGFYIAIVAAGVNLGEFGLLAGTLGVGIGFGLQGIVANFIAGLVLAFERPIQVGDTIEVGTMTGNVLHIGVRSSTIKTFDGSEIIIPNSTLISTDVINWTLSDRRKRGDVFIGVAYGTDPNVVLELIKKVATDHPEVLKIPAPWALFDGFGDNSLNFRVRIWTILDNHLTVKSDVNVGINNALKEAGIEIPFPQRDLHLRSIDKGVGEALNKKSNTKSQNVKSRQKKIEKTKEDKPIEDLD